MIERENGWWSWPDEDNCTDYLKKPRKYLKTAPIKVYTPETKEVKAVAEKQLYEIDNGSITKIYGHKLAVNSLGEWVMEIKGTGQVISVDKKNVSEVTPYSIRVQFNTNGQTYEYLDEKRQFEPGEFYIVDGYNGGAYAIARVVAVDTKSKHATKEFSPFKKIS